MKINREKLHELYMKKVSDLADEYNWITHFGPQEIVGMISTILENNPKLITNEKDTNTHE